MKRYIKLKNDTTVVEDRIVIDLDVYFPESIYSSITCKEDLFPGVDTFREDVVHILENDYNFQVIEDVYKGRKQKGYCSNRSDSISIYLDTYFDFSNAQGVFEKMHLNYSDVPEEGIVHCFIHLRFSDHVLNDDGDVAHRQFVSDNAKKYVDSNPSVTHFIKEEDIEVDPSLIYRQYNEALEDLKDAIEARMFYWIKHINRLNTVNRK